ncbi:hypothetical protein LINGRAPRIM_LOCUS2563, partial [Linum grandiflorum]
ENYWLYLANKLDYGLLLPTKRSYQFVILSINDDDRRSSRITVTCARVRTQSANVDTFVRGVCLVVTLELSSMAAGIRCFSENGRMEERWSSRSTSLEVYLEECLWIRSEAHLGRKMKTI